MKLGNDGRVALIGTLIHGVGGVDFCNNMGISVGTSDADLQLVVRTGQVIDGKVLMRLPSGLGQFDMNDDAIVWIRHLSVEKHGGRLLTHSWRERGQSGPGLERPAVTRNACDLSHTQTLAPPVVVQARGGDE